MIAEISATLTGTRQSSMIWLRSGLADLSPPGLALRTTMSTRSK